MITHDHEKIWKDCLSFLSHRIKKQSFATWLQHTYANSDGNGGIQINVPNKFVAEWVDEHYSEIIEQAIYETQGQTIPYSFFISRHDDRQTELEFRRDEAVVEVDLRRPAPAVINPIQKGMLHERYRFDCLVVGDFNQFPYAAALAVAEAPGKTKYNPLYIYGGTGLGKTHLLQAIGDYILNHDTTKRVMYATSERFTSDFISSISSNTTTDFVNMYRGVDVLLIDDTQFFSGKESTQEQFFHTFNALYNVGKQIVLTSDRPPKDIKGMEERLLSRFSWGLVTDIQPPDMETRTAILKRKAESESIAISEDIISYIANSVTSNIRELEGSLIRLLAYASLRGERLSLEMARSVLSGTFGGRHQPISIKAIKKNIADDFGIDIELLTAKKKTQNVVLARQTAMYLVRRLTKDSLKSIGNSFGGRDHSTVIHACNLVERLMNNDADFRIRIDNISKNLSGQRVSEKC